MSYLGHTPTPQKRKGEIQNVTLELEKAKEDLAAMTQVSGGRREPPWKE